MASHSSMHYSSPFTLSWKTAATLQAGTAILTLSGFSFIAYSTSFSCPSPFRISAKDTAAGYSCFITTLCVRKINPRRSVTVPLEVAGRCLSTTKNDSVIRGEHQSCLCVRRCFVAKTTPWVRHCKVSRLIRKFCKVVSGNNAADFTRVQLASRWVTVDVDRRAPMVSCECADR